MGRKKTEEAIEEARRGGLKQFDSVEALFADLNADDQVTPLDPAEALTTAEAVAAFLADAEATADPACIQHAGYRKFNRLFGESGG